MCFNIEPSNIAIILKYPAVVAWSVTASGHNTGPWQPVDRIPLETMNLYSLQTCVISISNGGKELAYA